MLYDNMKLGGLNVGNRGKVKSLTFVVKEQVTA
jgi:hypothetical protein